MPAELTLKYNLDHFGGALNVLGRPLGAKEIYRINYAEYIVNAYAERQRAEDWAVWAHNNREMAKALNRAHNIAEALDNGEDFTGD